MLLLLACAEPLPETADGQLHAAWTAWHAGDYDRAEDALLLLAQSPGDAEVSPLTETPGVMLVNPLPGCTRDRVEDLVVAADQDALFDIFEHYERTYTSSLDDWHADRQVLTWASDYGFHVPVAGSADATLHAEMRLLGDVLVLVNVLAEPAVWEQEGNTFDEDFRMEAWTQVDGRLVHVEGLWRHMIAGVYNTENEAVRGLVTNALYDWDEQMVALCAQAGP